MPEEEPDMSAIEENAMENRGIKPNLTHQEQDRLEQLRTRAANINLSPELGRKILTPTPVPENLVVSEPPVLPKSELRPVSPDQIPPQLLEQFLSSIPEENREETRRNILSGHSGGLNVATSLENTSNGHEKLKVELFDPEDPKNRMTWKGGGEGKAENAFSPADLDAFRTELLAAPATPEGRRRIVSKWCNIVERISGGSAGFADDSFRQGLEQEVQRAFFGDFATVNDLNDIIEARVGLDKVWRSWNLARYGVDKPKAEYYGQGGTFFSKAKRESLLRKMPGVWKAIQEIRAANTAGIKYFGDDHGNLRVALAGALIGTNESYTARDPNSKKDDVLINRATGAPIVFTPGQVMGPIDAEVAIFIAERILQVGQEAQEYGEDVVPGQGFTEGQGKALGVLGKVGAGFFQALTRGQIK